MLSKQQIGKCGELLVQYHLLRNGIESAPLTTDAGIDLVAYSPRTRRPITVQVKTNLQAKAAGGSGRPALNWRLRIDSPADLIALVDLSTESIWLLTASEYAEVAQQTAASGLHNLYIYVDPGVRSRHARVLLRDFEPFLFQHRVGELFGVTEP